MMDFNKYMVAASELISQFIDYIVDYDYERPLATYKLRYDAPEDVKRSFDLYKKNIELSKKMTAA